MECLSIPEDGYQKDPEQGVIPTLHPLDEIFNSFQSTPVVHSIRKLVLHMKEYDHSFLRAILTMTPELRELIVTYRGGGPDEVS